MLCWASTNGKLQCIQQLHVHLHAYAAVHIPT